MRVDAPQCSVVLALEARHAVAAHPGGPAALCRARYPSSALVLALEGQKGAPLLPMGSPPDVATNILCPDPTLLGLWDWRSPHYLQKTPQPAQPQVIGLPQDHDLK